MLAGCYVSDQPFIAADTADYPIADGAAFQVFRPAGDDWRPQPGRRVAREGAYYIYLEEPDGKRSAPFLIKRVAENTYVVQMNDTADLARVTEYYYQLIDFDGMTAIQYSGTCAARPGWIERNLIARVEDAAATPRCIFDNFENLVAVLAEASRNAAPEARFVLANPP